MSAKDAVAPGDVIQTAIDAVLKAGFATVEECIAAVESRRWVPGWQSLSVGAWGDVPKSVEI